MNTSISKDVWLTDAVRKPCDHFDERDDKYSAPESIDVLVIHNISLPPATSEADFDNHFVEDFFAGELNANAHPYFESISELRVSAHLYIKRTGEIIQFVPLNKRAWHAGVSEFSGREKCNDFSIGIEMQGTDFIPFTDAQYAALIKVTKQIQHYYPNIVEAHIVGHEHIAPGRKTDPGQCFDWTRYKSQL